MYDFMRRGHFPDDDLCRESVISHLRQESVPLSYQLDDSKESSYNAEMVTGAPARVEPENTEPWTLPTIITRGFAEFKFPAEQIVLGVVLERLSRSAKADKAQYIVTYSRNCHSWLPIRQRKNVGETQVFMPFSTGTECRRQSLTSKVGPRTERLKYLKWS